MTNPLTLKLFFFLKVPMLLWSGARVKEFNPVRCIAAMPFRRINRNPFKSMYFAVQGMAAELATAGMVMLAKEKFDENIAFIVVDVDANFFKKITETVSFTCVDYDLIESKIQEAVDTNEPIVVRTKSLGKIADGTTVAEFNFTWSFKVRK